MTLILRTLALFLITSAAVGCASITRGTTDTLIVESVPIGASVNLSNGLNGKTPATFVLPRARDIVVTVSLDGYETVTVSVVGQIDSTGSAAMAGNVVFGGLIGAAVDASTGAIKSLKPNPVSVTLTPASD